MIELTNTVQQTIPVGGVVTFDRVLLKSGCDTCYNATIPTSVGLRGNLLYDIEFHGNITSDAAATPLQLSVALGDSPLPQTTMNATPTAANDLVNVSAGTYLKGCGCNLGRISIRNTGANPVIIAANSSFRIAHLGCERR